MQSGKVRVITFTGGKGTNTGNAIAEELHPFTEGLTEGHLLLDFTNVENLSGPDLDTIV